MRLGEVYPSKYIRAEELEEDTTVTIKSVQLETLESKDGQQQKKPVCSFEELEKSLVLNKTNFALIAKQHGEDSEDWIGKKIVLTVLDVEAFGEMVQAVRIKLPRKTTAPKVQGVKKGSEVEQDGELINRYWTAVKSFGLDKKRGLKILQDNGGDFANALRFLENDDQVPM